MVSFVVWLTNFEQYSILKTLHYCSGILVRQGMPMKLNNVNTFGQLFSRLSLNIAALFLSSMYCSVVFAMLFSRKIKPFPKGVYELTYEFPNLKVYLHKQSGSYDYMITTPYWKDLEKRVTLYPDPTVSELQEMYENIAAGTHVSIQVWLTIKLMVLDQYAKNAT